MTVEALVADQTDVRTFANHIGGVWASCASGRSFENVNPAQVTDVVGRFQASGAEDGRRAVEAAAAAFERWRKTPIGRRARILGDAADILERNAAARAAEMTREMGKPVSLSRDEVLRSASTLRFYAAEGQSFTGEVFPQDDAKMLVYTQREPLGVVTAITPWNFPISIPARKIAPALITGNTVVFKPSSDAPLSGYRLAEALIEAGLPAGVLNLVTGSGSDLGAAITEAPQVRAISFTGSTRAGAHIHGSVPFTTRTQMELGGKNALVVLRDADLDLAVDLTLKGGLSLTGQACTGTSRVIVDRTVRPEFTDRLVARIKSLKIGDGSRAGIDIGPLATAKQLDAVLRYIEIGKAEAKLVYGGQRLLADGLDRGFFVSPAVFTEVPPQARIAREEIFGPVLAIMDADGFDDALAKANDTDYGLSASIVTRNPALVQRFCDEMQAGTVKINRPTTGNLINAPFGGLKQSSTSTFRESGRSGLEFYTQIKTVYRGC